MKHQLDPYLTVDRAQLRDPTGFTLVESLVCIVLVGLVATAVMSSMAFSVRASGAAEELTVLSARGAGQLEELTSLPFDNPGLVAGGTLATTTAGYGIDPVLEDASAYVRWQVFDEDVGLKRIVLISGRRDSSLGPGRELRFETFKIDAE